MVEISISLIPGGIISGSKCTSLLSIHISNLLSRKGKHFNSPIIIWGASMLPHGHHHTGFFQSQSKPSPQKWSQKWTFLCHFHHCSLSACLFKHWHLRIILFLYLRNLHLYLHKLYKHEEWPFGSNSRCKYVFRCQMEISVHQKQGFSRTRLCRLEQFSQWHQLSCPVGTAHRVTACLVSVLAGHQGCQQSLRLASS